MSIDLVLTYTSKVMFSQEEYRVYHEMVKHFPDIQEAKAWLKEEFYYCKTKKPMYIDKNDGSVVKCGQIYCYNERTNNTRGKDYTMNIQVWCTWYHVNHKVVDFDTIAQKSQGA